MAPLNLRVMVIVMTITTTAGAGGTEAIVVELKGVNGSILTVRSVNA